MRTPVSHRRPTVGFVRTAAAVGCVGLVGTGVNVLLMPAALVGLLAGIAGIRRTTDDLDAAALRLGVALVVSVLVTVPSLMGGGMPGLAGIVAAALFAVAWRGCERLRRQRRLEWGVRQRRILDRQAELHRRRDALRNAPVTDQGAGPPGTTESF